VTADSAGVFSTVLGSDLAINISFDGPSWLEVEVDGEVLLPRREMVSAPFAFHAMDADSVGGLPADSYSLATHNHDDRYYMKADLASPGAINDTGNPVDWTKLKNAPGGFADGIDDAGVAGDGYSLDATDGSPTDVVWVDEDGQVGIGTTNPDDPLDVLGYVDATDGLKINGATAFRMDSFNTYLGKDAGWVTGGSDSTFVGGEAGYNNASGYSNTFVGARSGRESVRYFV
jgi:hypothetical protein